MPLERLGNKPTFHTIYLLYTNVNFERNCITELTISCSLVANNPLTINNTLLVKYFRK